MKIVRETQTETIQLATHKQLHYIAANKLLQSAVLHRDCRVF